MNEVLSILMLFDWIHPIKNTEIFPSNHIHAIYDNRIVGYQDCSLEDCKIWFYQRQKDFNLNLDSDLSPSKLIPVIRPKL